MSPGLGPCLYFWLENMFYNRAQAIYINMCVCMCAGVVAAY